ncbi:MAG: hypothetical protein AB1797_04475 [bacterium]
MLIKDRASSIQHRASSLQPHGMNGYDNYAVFHAKKDELSFGYIYGGGISQQISRLSAHSGVYQVS